MCVVRKRFVMLKKKGGKFTELDISDYFELQIVIGKKKLLSTVALHIVSARSQACIKFPHQREDESVTSLLILDMKSCAVQEETDSPNDVGTRALVVSRVVFFFHAVNVERSTESDLLLRRFVSLAVYAREKKKNQS